MSERAEPIEERPLDPPLSDRAELGRSVPLAEVTMTTTITIEEMVHAGEGYLMVMRGNQCIASESDFDVARSARFLLALREAGIVSGTVAHIGGGMCIAPRLLGTAFRHDVYEIEPSLRRYVPEGANFIEGDYGDTLPTAGRTYDVILYDLGDETPAEQLAAYLNPGGVVLP